MRSIRCGTLIVAALAEVANAQTVQELRAQLDQTRQMVAEAEASGMDDAALSTLRDSLQVAEEAVREMEAEEASARSAGVSSSTYEPSVQKAATVESAGTTQVGNEPMPSEVAEGLEDALNLRLVPEKENAFVQINHRMFVCDGRIKMSYSLRPVPSRGINEVRFRGIVRGNGASYPFDTVARMSPGHRLGCDEQTVDLAPLEAHEKNLIQHQFTSGQNVWSREKMVSSMLSTFIVDGQPVPWPAGSK
jgi:hypothetical protein